MSRSKKIAYAVAVTLASGAVVGVVLWWGGGLSWQAAERTGWIAAIAAVPLPVVVAAWVWALRRPAFEQSHWGWTAPVRRVRVEQVGVHRSRGGASVYVARDRDTQLRPRIREAARTGGTVLVVGDSTAGKTRAAWEAVAAVVPRRRLFVPAQRADLSVLPDLVAANAARRAVVWLDDVDKHLNTSTGLDHALIQRLTGAGALVVLTLRTSAYNIYRDTAPDPGLDATEVAGVETGRRLLRCLDPVRLERLWSGEELRRAGRSGDARLVDAAQRQADGPGHGVAEYLAAAPELAERWHEAKNSIGADGGHPRGHRLVTAAVDLARIGVESATVELLEAAHTHYALPAHLRPEPFDQALAWATRVRFGASALLIPATTDPPTWRPFDPFFDATTPIPDIPDGLWDTALTHASDPAAHFAIGVTAHHTDLTALAETAFRKAIEGGHSDAMNNLGLLLHERGETGEAEDLWRTAAESGNLIAMNNLGLLLHRRGQLPEAESWYREAAEGGDLAAMYNLAVLLQERDEAAEAEAWWRRAADAGGDLAARYNLADLLEAQGGGGGRGRVSPPVARAKATAPSEKNALKKATRVPVNAGALKDTASPRSTRPSENIAPEPDASPPLCTPTSSGGCVCTRTPASPSWGCCVPNLTGSPAPIWAKRWTAPA